MKTFVKNKQGTSVEDLAHFRKRLNKIQTIEQQIKEISERLDLLEENPPPCAPTEPKFLAEGRPGF